LIFLFYLYLLLSLPRRLPGLLSDKAKGETGRKEIGEEERKQGKWENLGLREIRRNKKKLERTGNLACCLSEVN
jgi:hypothetical protein